MNGLYPSFVVPLLFATALISGIASLFAFSRRQAKGALPLAILMLAVAEWTLTYTLEIINNAPEIKIFWLQMEYIGILTIPVAWLVFALCFSRHENWVSPKIILFLSIFPMVVLLLVWTNGNHGLIWKEIEYISKEQTSLLLLSYGPVFWCHALYSYLLIFLSTFLFTRIFFRWSQPYRRQAGIILVGAIFPWLGNAIYLLQINPLPNLDLTSFAFAITGMIAFWGLFSFRLLEIVPIAQNVIIERMSDGLIVLDIEDRIVYLNPAVLEILGRPIEELIGKMAKEILSPWIDDIFLDPAHTGQKQVDKNQILRDITIKDKNAQRVYEISVSLIKEPSGNQKGRIVLWRDITGRKQEEISLRRQLEELKVLHAIASTCAQAEDEDTLIELVNNIIADAFYPDNFGVILLDEEIKMLKKHASYRDKLGTPTSAYPLSQGITGRVAIEGVSYRAADVSKDPNYWLVDPNIKSELCVPLKVGDRNIGVINAESTELNAYSEDDERLLAIFAGQLASTIERLRAEAVERQHVQELSAITQVSSEISSVLDQQEVLNLIVKSAAEISNSDASGLFSYKADGRLYLVAAFGVSDEFFNTLSSYGIPTKGTAVGEACTSRAPVQIPDIFDCKTYSTLELAELEDIRSILALPMMRGEETLGGIVLWHRKPRHFTDNEETFLQILANQSVNSIENARLFEAEREQRRVAEVLREIGYELSASLEFDYVLDCLLDQLKRLVPYDAANVMLVENGWIRVVRARGYSEYSEEFAQQINNLKMEVKTTANLNRLYQSQKPIIIPNINNDPDWIPICNQNYYNSWAGAPVVLQNKVVAFFSLDKTIPNFFNEEHAERLAAFTGQASLAWQNAKLFEETHRRAIIQEALNEIIAAAVKAPNLDQLLETVLELMINALEVDKGGLWVGDQSALHGLPHNIGLSSTRVFRQSYSSNADIQTKLLIEDWRQIKRGHELGEWIDHMEKYRIRATLFTPVISSGKRIGAISLASSSPRKWLPEEITLAEAIGRQIGSAVERLELLAKTQEQAQQVRHIIETVPEGVILLDTDGKIVMANPAAKKHLALLLDESELERPLTHLADQPIDKLLRIRPNSPWQEFQTQKEPRCIFEFAARPLTSNDQNEGWVLVLRDVTLDRENQAQTQMQERLATVGQLAAGIAHDFNNIMAAVVIYTDLLAMEPNLRPASLEQIKIIQKQVKRATSLIRQILDFSRRAVMEQCDIDLLPFIKELKKLLGRVLPETILLKLSHQSGPYWISADPTRLQQAFMNLALNARDAMPEGGILRFSLDRLSLMPEDTIPAPDLKAGNWVRITIQDNGSGIPSQSLSHIFEPFFTTKPVGQGTGLGLAQVYGIIKQHGGTIDVHSSEGKGSSFIIYLPEMVRKPSNLLSITQDVQILGSGETVLVIEDDQTARNAIQTLLERQDFRVLTASNGKNALELFKHNCNQISLVVSDIVMPEMSGITVYKTIQKNIPMMKFLFITGHPLATDTQIVLEEGKVHWLQKPFTVNEFSAALQEILREK